MIKVEQTKMVGKPLLQMNNGFLIAYYKGQLILYKNELSIMHISLPMPLWKRIACKIRLFERALHTDVRWAIDISPCEILFLFQNVVYKMNLNSGMLDKDFSGFRGQPFSSAHVGDRVLMGDYGTNDTREAVNIYERENGTWQTIYTFPSNTVRHVHNIIPHKDKIYILTGDEDKESGIWVADNDFHSITPLLVGKQQYRCCQLLINNQTGWYLTDAPSESNWLYHFSENGIKPICEIPGTVIYGTQYNDCLVFSTTVEPESHAKNRFVYWTTTKPGSGIKSNEVKVYLLKEGALYEIASFRHDGMPLRLFQYASVYFCNIINSRGYFAAASVKHYDNVIMRYEFS